jgi:hypothetical protein
MVVPFESVSVTGQRDMASQLLYSFPVRWQNDHKTCADRPKSSGGALHWRPCSRLDQYRTRYENGL